MALGTFRSQAIIKKELQKCPVATCLFDHFLSKFFPQVPIYQTVAQIKERREQDCDRELVHIIDNPHGDNLADAPIAKDVKGNPQHHKGIYKLRNQRRTGRPQPNHLLSGDFSQFLKHINIDQLTYQKGCQGADDNAQTLTKYRVEGKADVKIFSSRSFGVYFEPEISGSQNGHEADHDEDIGDQSRRDEADLSHALFTKVLIDNIRRKEHHRPDDHPCCQVKIQDILSKKTPVDRLETEGFLR